MKPQDAPAIARCWDALQTGADRFDSAASMALSDAATASPLAPRRIALVSAQASPLGTPGDADCGGQQVHVTHLARQLARAGVAVDIFTRRDAHGQRLRVDWIDNVRVIHVPAGPAHQVPTRALLPHKDVFARRVERLIRRQPLKYDLVHANCFLSGVAALHLKRTLGLPFTITFHAPGQAPRLPLAAADGFPAQRIEIEADLMREAGRVIVESEPERLQMMRMHGAAPARIAVAPPGFSSDEFWPVPMREARDRLRINPERFVILQLGRMAPRKGIDTLIQAAAMLRQRYAIDAELIVVGADSPLQDEARTDARRGGLPNALQRHDLPVRTDAAAPSQPFGAAHDVMDGAELARLRRLALELGIAPYVRFEGHRPRTALRDYYAASDVFASTPWHQPLGITSVEAMACARAVVGAEVSSIDSTVVDGVTGCLVPPRDPAALAERLAWLQRQPERARHMGQLGRVRACEHYTWQRVAQQVMALYSGLLEETRAAGRPALLSNQENA